MNRLRGFTLIELLVAIGIFALASAIAYGGLTRVLQDRTLLEQEHEFWRALSLTFTRLEDDLAQTRERTVRDVIGFPQPAFIGQPTDVRAVAAPNLEFTRGGVLTLSDGARSDLQRVAYRLTEGTLMRQSWPVLDRGPQTEPIDMPLLRDVEEFRVRFYAPADTWLEVWPTPGIDAVLPRGVEITLKLTGRGEFTRLIPIHG